MQDDVTGRSADYATYPADVAYLPGRTVTDGVSTGVVFAADLDGTVLVRWRDAGFTERCAAAELRAVNPDRPALAHDDLYAVTLGEELARRAGPAALAGFRDGYNNGHTTFKEIARDVLRRLDERALKAKHARCPHTYVVDPDGQRRPEPAPFEPGDRLVTCTFYADGPGQFNCGPHTGDRGSIFQPTPAGMVLPDDCAAIHDVIAVSPYETVGPVRVEVAA